MKKSQGINPKLLLRLGISPRQVDTVKYSCGRSLPEYWQEEIDQVQTHILSVLPLEISHWAIPTELIQKVFDDYEIVGSWRKTRRQLGNCSYHKKRIRINLGYIYHRSESARREQVKYTLIHEYVHAILYKHYNSNQKHNHRFVFYLRLLSGKTYRKGK
tara:strand:+ start:54 stop:530 length:477 start_codon:yes stop_codon:yes gene_type:complete